MFGDGLGHLFPPHAQRDAQPLVHLGVDVDRHRAAEHQRVEDAAVHVAGRMISSPRLQALSTMLCTELVVPPTIKKAWAAPNASAASSSASRMTDTGWQRLSSGFMLFTSTPTHCSPRKAVSSGLPRPRLWPGTSNGTTRMRRNFPALHGSARGAGPDGCGIHSRSFFSSVLRPPEPKKDASPAARGRLASHPRYCPQRTPPRTAGGAAKLR